MQQEVESASTQEKSAKVFLFYLNIFILYYIL